jgi:hypothetical protein
MPFDGIELSGTEQLVKLGAVERLLATEQQWCKGRLRDAHGRHCLVGAIEAVEGRQMLQRVVLQAAREVSGKRYWRINSSTTIRTRTQIFWRRCTAPGRT